MHRLCARITLCMLLLLGSVAGGWAQVPLGVPSYPPGFLPTCSPSPPVTLAYNTMCVTAAGVVYVGDSSGIPVAGGGGGGSPAGALPTCIPDPPVALAYHSGCVSATGIIYAGNSSNVAIAQGPGIAGDLPVCSPDPPVSLAATLTCVAADGTVWAGNSSGVAVEQGGGSGDAGSIPTCSPDPPTTLAYNSICVSSDGSIYTGDSVGTAVTPISCSAPGTVPTCSPDPPVSLPFNTSCVSADGTLWAGDSTGLAVEGGSGGAPAGTVPTCTPDPPVTLAYNNLCVTATGILYAGDSSAVAIRSFVAEVDSLQSVYARGKTIVTTTSSLADAVCIGDGTTAADTVWCVYTNGASGAEMIVCDGTRANCTTHAMRTRPGSPWLWINDEADTCLTFDATTYALTVSSTNNCADAFTITGNAAISGKMAVPNISTETSGTLTVSRTTAGPVTITAADDTGPATLQIVPGGAGALILGSGGTTAITLTTDGPGNTELLAPTDSIGALESLAYTVPVVFCGENGENGTVYQGPIPITSPNPGLDAATCDTLTNTTETSARARLFVSGTASIRPMSMQCITNAVLGAAETITINLRANAANLNTTDTTTFTCLLNEAETLCAETIHAANVQAASTLWTLQVTQASNNTDADDTLCVVYFLVQ